MSLDLFLFALEHIDNHTMLVGSQRGEYTIDSALL